VRINIGRSVYDNVTCSYVWDGKKIELRPHFTTRQQYALNDV
jgi:hypothetical protein